MFKPLKKYHNQKGQVVVLFIFIFIILCGVTGWAIDTWLIVYNKQQLQNAVDLSALATAHECMNNHEQVVNTAIEFGNKNGIATNELTITHPYKGEANKVELSANKTINLLFMPTFGKKKKTISARAVAELLPDNTSSYIFDYAIFSGDENKTFEIRGSKFIGKGNVHINGDVLIQGSNIHFKEDFECVGPVITGGSNIHFKNLIRPSEILPMIVINMEALKAKASIIYKNSTSFSDSRINIDGIMFVDGDVDLSGCTIKGKGTIIANGNIHISGSSFKYDAEDEFVCLYANKDIEISGSNIKVEGALYAPNGMIKMNGSKNQFEGALIAKYFECISGSDISVKYDSRAKNVMGNEDRSIHLIE